MRRLVTSDIQLSKNPRDAYRMAFFSKALPDLVLKYKPDQLILCGDITEEKDNHPASLVNEIVNSFCALADLCEVIVLQGNHDFLHNEHPFFAFLENWKSIHWISRPEELDGCLYLPHTRDYKKDWKSIDFTNDGKNYDFIFAHNIFEGVKANGQLLSGISSKIFPDDICCISGDVHEPQTIADGKIIYVGSPCLCDHGDNYQPRVLLLEDLNIKSIKVYGVQKRLIDFTYGDTPFDDAANDGDIVKIRVNLEMKHIPKWAEIRQEVESWATKNKWIISSIAPVVAYVQGERQKLVSSSKKSDNEYLTSFVQRTGMDEHTAEVGNQIIELV